MSKIDNKRLTKLLSYIILGDGGVYYTKARNAQFIMNMKAENKDYIEFVQSILENVTGTNLYERKDYNIDGCTRQPQLRLESKTHPIFTTLRERIYIDNYKGLDPHTLKLLDAEAMAILYMCDGSFQEYLRPEIGMINPSFRLTLNMKRLSYGDQLVLKNQIKESMGVEFNINRNGKYYYLNLRVKDVESFLTQVAPYMSKSFYYKLGRFTPTKLGGDIVCSSQKCEEVGGNIQPPQIEE
jgi:hypothetical protein